MAIILQINNSDNRAINKSLTDVLTLSGTIRQETSIKDLTITFEGELATFATCNYLTVEELGRSYFIKDIVTLRTGLVQITAHIDVLYTYRTQILNQVAVLGRQESKYNLYMDDSAWYTTCKKQRKVINFPVSFETNNNMIMTVIGGC